MPLSIHEVNAMPEAEREALLSLLVPPRFRDLLAQKHRGGKKKGSHDRSRS